MVGFLVCASKVLNRACLEVAGFEDLLIWFQRQENSHDKSIIK
jgi:hypothetical protein